jgi:hypothetical protein
VDHDAPGFAEGLDPDPTLGDAPEEGSVRRIDRRDVMKKAAIGASAVWVAPKITGLSKAPKFAGRLSPCTGKFLFNALLAGSINDSNTSNTSPIGITEHLSFQACGTVNTAIRQDYQPGVDAFSVMAVNVNWASDNCVIESLNVDAKRNAINAPVQHGPTPQRQIYITFSNKATDGDNLGLDNRPSGGGVLHLGVTCT